MEPRKLLFGVIIGICVLSFLYAVFSTVGKRNPKVEKNTISDSSINVNTDFDSLFDNDIHYQGFEVGNENKIYTTKELVYTAYIKKQAEEGKYDISVDLPIINLSNNEVRNINREIISVFGEKAESIILNSDTADFQNTIYTVEYTAYLNQNILSLVIKSTLKEGNNAQRVIIKAYTYNISSNEIIPLSTMLEIKELNATVVRNEIQNVVKENINKNANLAALGYNVYQRDLNSNIYEIANSDNFLLGPNGIIYIIYAYGNTRYTSEKDIVMIK